MIYLLPRYLGDLCRFCFTFIHSTTITMTSTTTRTTKKTDPADAVAGTRTCSALEEVGLSMAGDNIGTYDTVVLAGDNIGTYDTVVLAGDNTIGRRYRFQGVNLRLACTCKGFTDVI